jgi:hypothetical protein
MYTLAGYNISTRSSSLLDDIGWYVTTAYVHVDHAARAIWIWI